MYRVQRALNRRELCLRESSFAFDLFIRVDSVESTLSNEAGELSSPFKSQVSSHSKSTDLESMLLKLTLHGQKDTIVEPSHILGVKGSFDS